MRAVGFSVVRASPTASGGVGLLGHRLLLGHGLLLLSALGAQLGHRVVGTDHHRRHPSIPPYSCTVWSKSRVSRMSGFTWARLAVKVVRRSTAVVESSRWAWAMMLMY